MSAATSPATNDPKKYALIDVHERRLWEMCNAKAVAKDRTIMGNWKSHMDSLIIFVALFTGVAAALFLQSYALLLPDNDRILAALSQISHEFTNATQPDTPSNDATATWTAQLSSALFLGSLVYSLWSALGVIYFQQRIREYLHESDINVWDGAPLQQARTRAVQYNRVADSVSFARLVIWSLYAAIYLFFCGVVFMMYHLGALFSTISGSIVCGVFLLVVVRISIRNPDSGTWPIRDFMPPIVQQSKAVSPSQNWESKVIGRLVGVASEPEFQEICESILTLCSTTTYQPIFRTVMEMQDGVLGARLVAMLQESLRGSSDHVWIQLGRERAIVCLEALWVLINSAFRDKSRHLWFLAPRERYALHDQPPLSQFNLRRCVLTVTAMPSAVGWLRSSVLAQSWAQICWELKQLTQDITASPESYPTVSFNLTALGFSDSLNFIDERLFPTFKLKWTNVVHNWTSDSAISIAYCALLVDYISLLQSPDQHSGAHNPYNFTRTVSSIYSPGTHWPNPVDWKQADLPSESMETLISLLESAKDSESDDGYNSALGDLKKVYEDSQLAIAGQAEANPSGSVLAEQTTA
ncbi:hypothetical protein C8J56DRAFT_1022028 [Mycena floridula]|nr:hypothetical protein C8J56DRAFT_1022028 [Mycena floridula]